MLSSPFPIEYLSELIEKFEAGVNYPPISENELASEWRVLKISAVTWGEFNPKESKPIKPNTVFADSLIVRKGDLIISRANTTELVGAVALVRNTPPKVLLSDKLWRIKFSENSRLLPEYALLALRQPEVRRIIEELATGSSGSMQNISMEKAAIIPIPLPPIAEQKRIAAIAQKCDRLRRTRRYTQQLSDSYLQSVFLQIFGDLRSYELKELDEVCSKIFDCKHYTPPYVPKGIPLIKTNDVVPGVFKFGSTVYVSSNEYEKLTDVNKPTREDIVFAREGSFGVASYINDECKYAIGQRMMLLRTDAKQAHPIYLTALINSPFCQEKLLKISMGTTVKRVNVADVKALPIALPPFPLQEKFAQIVQRFERLRTQQREADRQAEHLFQTILHRAFRGEL